MKILSEQLQNILDNLSRLLSQNRKICLNCLNELPNKIEEIIVGENKLLSYADGSISEIVESDLKNIVHIDDYTFFDCFNLTRVVIPSHIIGIGSYAFCNCSGLIDMYLHPITPPTLANTSTIPDNATIHVPIGSGDAYKNATNWSSFATRIVEDIEI